jgi:heterogeneous nuclear rnp K-like protein 2
MDTTDIHEAPIADETMTDAVNVGDEGDLEVTPKTEEEYAQSMLTLRAIVSSKEAGVIIGKAGKNVADLRDETGVKAGVSKVVPGVHDRVLTVTGALSGTARAYALVAKGLLEGAPQMGMGGIVSNNGTHRKFYPIYTHSLCLGYERLLTFISYSTVDFS